VSTDLVVFPVRVTDKNRKTVVNLTEHDLILRDTDKVVTAPYLAFGAERVAMIFALDESGSLREIISQQRNTAVALFTQFEQQSRIAVLRFAESPKVVVGFEKDTANALAAFNFGVRRNRRTAIFNAAGMAVDTFGELTDDPAERRIVVLLSDGLDNASTLKANNVIDAAREKGISFYVIHLPLFEPRDGRLAVRSPSKGFRELAEKTGGRYFIVGEKSPLDPAGKNDLSPIFKAIAEDLKSQYLLGFYVGEAARDGRKHRVSITLANPNLSYSVSDRGFSRTHHFSVNMLPTKDPKSNQ
jgi:Ca-activated chloride channel family protein